MRYFIVFIFLFACSINIFSQEINGLLFEFDPQFYYYGKIEKETNISIRFIIPPPNENTFCFLDISAGIYFRIVTGFYYIGVAGDIALGVDWFTLFSNDDNRNRNNNNEERNYQLGLSAGGRFYNLFQINNFRIWQFVGCDFLFIFLPMPHAGMELSYKSFGIEYAYHFPIIGYPARHQISIKLHLPK
ncbi:MAG: hypothetical protein LBU85_13045 [Treponema sp.]|jgi:hypothetical protein|nr:hypothetical protein [Treponema sp.]